MKEDNSVQNFIYQGRYFNSRETIIFKEDNRLCGDWWYPWV